MEISEVSLCVKNVFCCNHKWHISGVIIKFFARSLKLRKKPVVTEEMGEYFTKCLRYQFMFANASPEKEQKFQRLKKQAKKRSGQGVIQAWHGSPFANWHAIMRTGLKNMSGEYFLSTCFFLQHFIIF